MKKISGSILFSLAILLIVSCSKRPVQTLENLKTAVNGESTASAKYAAFAVKAQEEGYDTIAVLFRAASKSEAVHAFNHKRILDSLDASDYVAKIDTIIVLTTEENLNTALNGEAYEVATMYPGFIETGRSEKCAAAVKTFTWASIAERKHYDFYKRAIAVIATKAETSLPAHWFVCPTCGNTYDDTYVTAVCEICMTKPDEFINFETVLPAEVIK